MNFNLSSMPATIDMLHLILAVLPVVFLILFFSKKKSTGQPITSGNQIVTPSEIEAPAILKTASPDAALQLLSLLQQDARFIDFVKEDLSSFSDADIGAAARVVHEGSKKTLDTYFTLEAVRNENEESPISLPEGFNASEVRLTGNVVGEAPFNGTLIHKGWRVIESKLPKIAEGHDVTIIAPAEVEL